VAEPWSDLVVIERRLGLPGPSLAEREPLLVFAMGFPRCPHGARCGFVGRVPDDGVRAVGVVGGSGPHVARAVHSRGWLARRSYPLSAVAVIIAVGANTDGRREVLGVAVGPSEAEPFWAKFLRSLTARGLRGVRHLVADSHNGLKTAAKKVLSTQIQRCRVHFMRNVLAHAGKRSQAMISAAIRTAFVQETKEAAHKEWRAVSDRLRIRFPKVADCMDEAEHDVLAYMSMPKEHWSQIHSTNPIERSIGR
jgi:hypothetical protein